MRFLTKHDVWDLALFDEIRIVKRWVYSRPALGFAGNSCALTPDKPRKKVNFKLAGRLANGVSTKRAWIEVSEACSK